jgi:hypothetical protein
MPEVRRRLAMWLTVAVVAAALATPTDAEARRRRKKRRANPPSGWVWPPSREMRAEGKRCLAHLDELGVVWQKGKRTRRIATPVVIPGMELGGLKLTSIFRKPPFVMDCHLAEALAAYGPVLRGMGITELRFSSIHSYRRVRLKRRTKPYLSRHAWGLAMDVYGFVTADGETYDVRKAYRARHPVLLAAETAIVGTGAFALLTPGNDPRSHYDHFHFEVRVDGENVGRGPAIAQGADAPSPAPSPAAAAVATAAEASARAARPPARPAERSLAPTRDRAAGAERGRPTGLPASIPGPPSPLAAPSPLR